MDAILPSALLLALLLVLLAVIPGIGQWRQLRNLHSGVALASEDYTYLRNRARRRLLNGLFMLVIAGMLVGTYLSGMEARASDIASKSEAALKAGVVREREAGEREFLQFYAAYWIAVLMLVFAIMTVAVVDFWSTRRYAMAQLKRIREDQEVRLGRDLEVYRMQRVNDRMRTPSTPSEDEPID